MSLAPEPFRTACLIVISDAILYVRAFVKDAPYEQIVDLMDAVHDLPAFLQNWETCDQEWLRATLKRYDEKWPKDISLLTRYDRAIARCDQGSPSDS